jgi:N-acetyl-anhydromuramyl-L-alanine amidase AmpD
MASNIQNVGSSTSTSSTGGTRSDVVRVFDIVLDANHPIFDNIPYDPTLIGMIFYGDKDLDVTSTNPLSLPKALPKWGPQKLPLKYELVKIETGPSPDIYTDIGGNNAFNYVYYGEIIPVFANVVSNELPSQKELASTTSTSEESVLASNGTPNQSQPKEIILDDTGNFQPKNNIKPLQPYAGDFLIQGRAGQTWRLGTTNKEGANNWSDGDTFGDGVMIFRVGQSEDQQGSTVVEDINGDASSIYMLSNQKLNNIQLTSTNVESCAATYTAATVPLVQLALAPVPPLKPIPNPLPEPFLVTGSIIVETSSPQVTSSFSEDELDDPVFAALAEAEEEGLIDIETIENVELAGYGLLGEDSVEEYQTSSPNTTTSQTSSTNTTINQAYSGTDISVKDFVALPHAQRDKIARDKVDKDYVRIYPNTNVKAKKFYSARDLSEAYVSEALPIMEAIQKLVKAQPARSGVKCIVLHYTGGSAQKREGKAAGERVTLQHLCTDKPGASQPWPRQGYHYLVGTDGKVCALVPETTPSIAICENEPLNKKSGFRNSNSININFPGGVEGLGDGIVDFKGRPTQFKAYGLLLQALMQKYPNAKVIGHNQVGEKPCPGFWVPRFLERFNATDRIADTGYNAYNKKKWIDKADEIYETIKDVFN